MLTIDRLKEYGANVEEGLGRCMNNESFYLRMVGLLLDDKNIDNLEQAIENNDLDKAFEAAHALKGIAGNLSLTPIFEPALEVTELLRKRTEMDYSEYVSVLKQKRDELRELAE